MKPLTQFMEELIEDIKEVGILFGSRQFGGADINSDWDYMISEKYKDYIFRSLNESEIDWWMINTYGDNNMYCLHNIKFQYLGVWFNILIYSDDKFKIIKENLHWFNTNGSELNTLLVSDKKARAYLFNGFLHYLFGEQPKPFECNEANRIPCIKFDPDECYIWLAND